jgi:hypothetical protein
MKKEVLGKKGGSTLLKADVQVMLIIWGILIGILK